LGLRGGLKVQAADNAGGARQRMIVLDEISFDPQGFKPPGFE
jgi:hypothetical protein